MINFQFMSISIYSSLAGTGNTERGKNSSHFEPDDIKIARFNFLKAEELGSSAPVHTGYPVTKPYSIIK